ncbi:M15 family metallopeptidase [Ruegeria halocynthiae]|uniref:M15 family metallopeptidase n=1 Tax=Ruegeria halocynthiae TaxID=985054 RepID=UPI000B11D84A|nr:M15 family metallopeptidase [Ruegeria halocynthiae]
MSEIELKKLELLDREIRVKERGLEHNIANTRKNSWKSPLVVAIFAAAVGALGNAVVTYYSSSLDRAASATEHERNIVLAETAAERERILEMIGIGDPEQVQRNLEFLIDTELVQDPETVASIREYYEDREPGTGPGASLTGTVSFEEIGIDRSEVNGVLIAPSTTFLEENLGKPREVLSEHCEPITNEVLKAKLETAIVGGLRVHLLEPAIRSLEEIFSVIEDRHPDLSQMLGVAGSLCVRNYGDYTPASSHSWGTAIDISLNGQLDNFNDEQVDVDLYRIALVFIENGWVWGGGFEKEDSIHFEVSEQQLRRWISEGVL